MESSLVSRRRLEQTRNWGYPANSQDALWIEEQLSSSRYPVVTLGDHITGLAGGLTPRGANYPDAGIVFIRVGNIQRHGLDLSDVNFIDEELHNGELQRCQLQENDVLLAITGATFGKACVVPPELGEANINQHIARIRTTDELNPYYLANFFNSELGTKQSLSIATGGTRPALDYKAIRSVRLPLPSLSVQENIVQAIHDVYNTRQQLIEELQPLLQEVNDYIFATLGLRPEVVPEDARFLRPFTDVKGGRLDVDFNMGFHKFDPYLDQVKAVQCVATFPKDTRNLRDQSDIPFAYIDISSVDAQIGAVVSTTEMLGVDAPSRARQIVRHGDIIVSTVRPTRGATAYITEDLDGCVCSTGFTIVRPGEGVNGAYLHAALRLNTTLEQFGRRSAGASYPAILEDDVKETLIPVPALEIQNEIATEVTRRYSRIRVLRGEADAAVSHVRMQVERMMLGNEEAV